MEIANFQADSTTSDSCLVSKAMLVFQKAGKNKTFTFQFNPSTLHIHVEGGSWLRAVGRVKPEQAQQVEYREVNPNIRLSFKVYFDAMEKAEAFIADQYALYSWTNAAKAIYKSHKNTVRPIVEGFLGAIRNNNYRIVMFQWGKMRHIGYMDKVNCKYTMFSPKGEPIRAEMDFEIVACGSGEDGVVELWKKRYDEILKGGAVKTTNASNIATNLLNMQI